MLIIDLKIPHPISFNVDGGFPSIGREIKVVTRQVFAGPSIIATAIALRLPIDVARLQSLSSLKHEVFEIMRKSSRIQFFIAGTDTIGDHCGDRWCAGNWLKYNLESIGECLNSDVVVKR